MRFKTLAAVAVLLSAVLTTGCGGGGGSEDSGNGGGGGGTVIPPPPPADSDGDGVADTLDNCRLVGNPDQTDVDRDSVGDFCDHTYNPSTTAPTPTAIGGAKRLLVTHFLFSDTPSPPFPMSATQTRLEGDSPFSIKNFFLQMSYGASQQSYQYRDWARLPHPASYYQAQPTSEAIVSDALAYVGAHYDTAASDAVVLIVDYLPNGGGPGCFAVPGGVTFGSDPVAKPYAVLPDGANLCGADKDTMAHEIGHLYQLNHASEFACNSWPGGLPQSLTDPSYSPTSCGTPFGDGANGAFFAYGSYDVMGSYRGQTSSYNKSKLGWLKPANLAQVTANANYTLEAYETASDGLKSLQIPLGLDPDGKPSSIWADYRPAPLVDLEQQAVVRQLDKVVLWINLGEIYDANNKVVTGSETVYFDGINDNGANRPMALAVGESYTDPYRGLKVSRGADGVAAGLKNASVMVQRSAISVSPAIGAKLGSSSTDITLTNGGNVPLSVSGASIGGRSPSMFSKLSDGCSGITLQATTSCKVTVTQMRTGGDISRYDALLQFATSDSLRPSPTVGLIGLSSP